MDTLLRAGTIRSIKEVWSDSRPHPDFGTVEVRMFDGMDVVDALAAEPAHDRLGSLGETAHGRA